VNLRTHSRAAGRLRRVGSNIELFLGSDTARPPPSAPPKPRPSEEPLQDLPDTAGPSERILNLSLNQRKFVQKSLYPHTNALVSSIGRLDKSSARKLIVVHLCQQRIILEKQHINASPLSRSDLHQFLTDLAYGNARVNHSATDIYTLSSERRSRKRRHRSRTSRFSAQ
jgi:hypothetical protein